MKELLGKMVYLKKIGFPFLKILGGAKFIKWLRNFDVTI